MLFTDDYLCDIVDKIMEVDISMYLKIMWMLIFMLRKEKYSHIHIIMGKEIYSKGEMTAISFLFCSVVLKLLPF
jgi:hypothetical protein